MSTLKTTNIAHPSSASNNIVLDSSGGVDMDAFTVDGSAPADSVNLDSSGRLLVGTSTTDTSYYDASTFTPHIQLKGANGNTAGMSLTRTDGSGPIVWFQAGSSGNNVAVNNVVGGLAFSGFDGANYRNAARIEAFVDGTPGSNDMPGRLVFSTTADGASSPTERMRIDNTGAQYAYSTSDGITASVSAAAASSGAIFEGKHSATAVKTGTGCFAVRYNGNVINTNNSYGQISDIKLKENIVDANSQWSDIKAVRVRNFNFKEGQTHRQIGVIAQELEEVSPGLVSESPDRDEDGNDLDTVTKSVNYSVLYMKAVKALQEAMERIETLEAEVAALKAS